MQIVSSIECLWEIWWKGGRHLSHFIGRLKSRLDVHQAPTVYISLAWWIFMQVRNIVVIFNGSLLLRRVASQVLLLCVWRNRWSESQFWESESARDDLVRYFWTVIFPPEPSFYTPVPIEGISLSALYVYIYTRFIFGGLSLSNDAVVALNDHALAASALLCA